MKDTIHAIDTVMAVGQKNSLDPANTSCLQLQPETPYLFGENSSTILGNTESIALCSGMNPNAFRLTLSERLTPSLISAGLVSGTTLTFGLRLLNRGIQAGVLYARNGTAVDIPNQDSLF